MIFIQSEAYGISSVFFCGILTEIIKSVFVQEQKRKAHFICSVKVMTRAWLFKTNNIVS